jgi:hypothetical protein
MTVTIELPKNKKEASFLMDLLKKLNVNFVQDMGDFDISEEHKKILDERIKDFELNPNQKTYTWEEVKASARQR